MPVSLEVYCALSNWCLRGSRVLGWRGLRLKNILRIGSSRSVGLLANNIPLQFYIVIAKYTLKHFKLLGAVYMDLEVPGGQSGNW